MHICYQRRTGSKVTKLIWSSQYWIINQTCSDPRPVFYLYLLVYHHLTCANRFGNVHHFITISAGMMRAFFFWLLHNVKALPMLKCIRPLLFQVIPYVFMWYSPQHVCLCQNITLLSHEFHKRPSWVEEQAHSALLSFVRESSKCVS